MRPNAEVRTALGRPSRASPAAEYTGARECQVFCLTITVTYSATAPSGTGKESDPYKLNVLAEVAEPVNTPLDWSVLKMIDIGSSELVVLLEEVDELDELLVEDELASAW